MRLKARETLALFYDETTVEIKKLLQQAADLLDIRVLPRCVTLAEQASQSASGELNPLDLDALNSARGIVTCVSDHLRGTGWRGALIRNGCNLGQIFGHMPGATLAIFEHALDIDYNATRQRADGLMLALLIGQRCRLESYEFDAHGEPLRSHSLEFSLGGYSRLPVVSLGRIAPGSWGNLPGAEVFIAPMEGTATGSFALNGSFTDVVMPPGRSIILHFDNGSLIGRDGAGREFQQFEALLADAAIYPGNHHLCVAELGIGLNPGVRVLSGKSLVDEKCDGTAHIAIGDNTDFGGTLESTTHEDFVTIRPSVYVNDKAIILRGRQVLEIADWLEPHGRVMELQPINTQYLMVSRTGAHIELDPDEILRVTRDVRGRICSYRPLAADASRTMARIFAVLPQAGQSISLRLLMNRLVTTDPRANEAHVRTCLEIGERHGILALEYDPE